jgi:hypothetical protein
MGSGLASAIRASSCAGLSWNLAYSPSFSALMRASLLFFGSAKTSHLLVWKDLRSGIFLSSGFQVAAAECSIARPDPRGAGHVKSILDANPIWQGHYTPKPKQGSEITNTMHDSHYKFLSILMLYIILVSISVNNTYLNN